MVERPVGNAGDACRGEGLDGLLPLALTEEDDSLPELVPAPFPLGGEGVLGGQKLVELDAAAAAGPLQEINRASLEGLRGHLVGERAAEYAAPVLGACGGEMAGKLDDGARDAVAADKRAAEGGRDHGTGVHADAEIEALLPAPVALAIEFLKPGDEVDRRAGRLGGMIGRSFGGQRRAEDDTDALAGALVEVASHIDQEIRGDTEVEIHKCHVIRGPEHLHELDVVVNGADEHRGLVQFTGKIDRHRAIDQAAEDLGPEALSEEPPQDRLARTGMRLTEDHDRRKTEKECGDSGGGIQVGTKERGNEGGPQHEQR